MGKHTEEDDSTHEIHRESVTTTIAEREKDRSTACSDTLDISFDSENIFALPKCHVSSAFYKCKLTTYNLTAIVQSTKKNLLFDMA